MSHLQDNMQARHVNQVHAEGAETLGVMQGLSASVALCRQSSIPVCDAQCASIPDVCMYYSQIDVALMLFSTHLPRQALDK